MTKPLCVVPVADLESGPKQRRWTLPIPWLEATFAETDATPRGVPGELDVELSLNGREVFIRGRVRAEVQMPCARTLDPVEVDIDAEVFLLLEPAVPTPAQRGQGRSRGNRKRQPQAKAEEAELSPEDAARDTYDGEQVLLDTFVREFLLLDLPMVPLRSDLRSAETTTISGAPGGDAPGVAQTATLDPRLAPLAEIARRLRDKE